ncbi:TRAP transporter large permease [Bacillus sp. 1P02SD]|uniref:TRAP transporter large permease n=1 Tax=Bacillus sp. 1P02SD TaxID=3132264 RepID=UPI0039A38401
MTSGFIVALVIILLFVLLFFDIPIAFALLASGLVGIVLLKDWDVAAGALANIPFQSTAKYTLIVIPLFLFMGLLAQHGRIAEDVFNFAHRFLRKLPGSLGIATVAACAGFAAVSGSSVATAATVGKLTIGEMRKHGYNATFATGIVGAAGTLGILIPPSLVLIIYGTITNESIGKLLLAGIIPGLLTAAIFMIAIVIIARFRPSMVEVPQGSSLQTLSTSQFKSQSYWGVLKIAILFVIVMGGIYSGIFTATESAAIGALVALIMLILQYRKHRKVLSEKLVDSLLETAKTTCMVFAILVGASLLTYFFTVSLVPTRFAEWVTGLGVSPVITVALLLVIFIPLGMFLDGMSILLITIPLVYPVVTHLGFDGIWFGILAVKMIELGLITPPLGVNAFVVAGSAKDVSIVRIFKGLGLFMVLDLIVISLLFMFPELTTWLPNLADK